MSKEPQGWISIHRTLWENPIFFSEPFNKALAWIDLLMLARHKKQPELYYIRGNEVWVNYGEIARAESTLCERWKWSRSKLRKFIKNLEKEQQIKIIKTPCINKIAIVNYEKYQDVIQQKDDRKTAERRQKDLNNNVNNENNVNNDSIITKQVSYNTINKSDFKTFWNLYPRKINEIHAERLFNKVIQTKQATINQLLEGAIAYKEAMEESKTEERFIMSPDKWLERSCWCNSVENYKPKTEFEKMMEQFIAEGE